MKHSIVALLVVLGVVIAMVLGVVFWLVGYLPYLVLTEGILRRKKKKFSSVSWVYDLVKDKFKPNANNSKV